MGLPWSTAVTPEHDVGHALEGTAFQGVSVIRDPAEHHGSPSESGPAFSICSGIHSAKRNTASGVAEGGVEDLNGAYRARTGDLLLAKQLLSQLS